MNAKMSQKEAASQLKVNPATVSNWETGKTSPNANQFKQLCDLYKCPMDIIFLSRDSLKVNYDPGQ